jgi:hypothetical protein
LVQVFSMGQELLVGICFYSDWMNPAYQLQTSSVYKIGGHLYEINKECHEMKSLICAFLAFGQMALIVGSCTF